MRLLLKKIPLLKLILISVLLSLVVGYLLYARSGLIAGISPNDTKSICISRDTHTIHRFTPNCKTSIIRAGSRSEMQYNALGLRDKNYSALPQKGWLRILILGPSRIAGPGLQEADTPPRVLERILRKSLGNNIEVINGGVEAYRTAHMSIQIDKLLKAYSPTHVVYIPTMRVGVMDLLVSREMQTAPNGSPFALTYRDANTQMLDRLIESWRCKILSPKTPINCLFKSTLSFLLHIKDRVETSGAKFLVLSENLTATNKYIYNTDTNLWLLHLIDFFTPQLSASDGDVRSMLASAQIPYQVFTKKLEGPFFLKNDDHYNVEGAKAWAKAAAMVVKPMLVSQ